MASTDTIFEPLAPLMSSRRRRYLQQTNIHNLIQYTLSNIEPINDNEFIIKHDSCISKYNFVANKWSKLFIGYDDLMNVNNITYDPSNHIIYGAADGCLIEIDLETKQLTRHDLNHPHAETVITTNSKLIRIKNALHIIGGNEPFSHYLLSENKKDVKCMFNLISILGLTALSHFTLVMDPQKERIKLICDNRPHSILEYDTLEQKWNMSTIDIFGSEYDSLRSGSGFASLLIDGDILKLGGCIGGYPTNSIYRYRKKPIQFIETCFYKTKCKVPFYGDCRATKVRLKKEQQCVVQGYIRDVCPYSCYVDIPFVLVCLMAVYCQQDYICIINKYGQHWKINEEHLERL